MRRVSTGDMRAPNINKKARWFGLPRFSNRLDEPDSGGKTRNARNAFPAVLRIVGSLVFLCALFWLVDLAQVQANLARLSWPSLAMMVVLHVVIILLTAWRFFLIARSAGSPITKAAAIRLTFPSTLANMLLPTSLAGDAGRIWLVRHFSLSLKDALFVGVFDRVIGLASLGAVVLVGALFAPSILPLWSVLVLFAACAAIILILLIKWRSADQSTHRSGLRKLVLLGSTTALSVSAHLVSIVIALVFLHSQPETVSMGAMAVLFPAVLLAASIPVSVGGWGVREIAAVTAFGVIGVSTSSAVAMAFMFGVTQTLAAGLGTAMLMASTRTGLKAHA